jgi:adenylosuccinate synthase
MRNNSFAFCGGAYGDEGKGRIVDEFVGTYTKKGNVIVYRDNGGANAGHTVELVSGKRVAFHQLPSGIFNKKAIVVLGKGMVIHPSDLVSEISVIRAVGKTIGVARIMIDEMATLSLDTHRAYESALKMWQEGGKGATGRGISPAYADILLRHPLRIRDILEKNTEKLKTHYRLYKALLNGLGFELSTMIVPALNKKDGIPVGSENVFIRNVYANIQKLHPYVSDVSDFLRRTWRDETYTYIFEKAQAIGLDCRWGVYPDVTASDTTIDGIFAATEGIINPSDIRLKAGVMKATYMSSVGTRILPTIMEDHLANKIREDAFEYGATTKRPRGIAYLDIPALSFFARVGKLNRLVLTHMDVVYPDVPIKVCVGYTKNKKQAFYRPDQQYLLTVKPVYREFVPWDKTKIQNAKTYKDIPVRAKEFLRFIEKSIGVKILMITTGPRRDQSISMGL